jgi:PAS domain S-box-containing protein
MESAHALTLKSAVPEDRRLLDRPARDQLAHLLIQALRPTLGLLALTFLGLAAYEYWLARGPAVTPLAYSSAVTAGALLLLYAALGLAMAARFAHAVGALAALLVMGNCFARLPTSEPTLPVAALMLTLVAAGGLFVSSGWFAVVGMVALAGSVYVAGLAGFTPPWPELLGGVLVAGATGLCLHQARVKLAAQLVPLQLERSQAEAALQAAKTAAEEAEARFQRLSAAAFEGMALQVNERIVEANVPLAALFGYSPEELLGKSFLELVSPTSRAAVAESIRLGNFHSFEAVGLRKDGTTLPVEILSKPIPYDGRSATALAVRDLTEHKRIEQALAQEKARLEVQYRRQVALAELDLGIQNVRDLATLGAKVTACAQDLLQARAGAALLLRDTAEAEVRCIASRGTEPTGAPVADAVLAALNQPAGVTRWILEHQEVFLSSDTGADPFDPRRELAQRGIRAYAGVPLLNEGRSLGALFVFDAEPHAFSREDLSWLQSLAQRTAVSVGKLRADLELRRSHALLRHQHEELQTQSAELTKAKQAAEAASRAKTEFLATISHELKTPLNGIIGMNAALLATALDDDQRDCVQTAQHSAETLLELIDRILDYAQLESGGVTLARVQFDPRQVVSDCAAAVQAAARAKGLRLNVHLQDNLPVRVCGDLRRFRQVLANLLDNAVKFTPQGEIAVHAQQLEQTPTHCVLRVAVHDTGVGIPPAARSGLFEAFRQAEGSHARKHGGVGLGLAICRQFVHTMGGEIAVDSEPGRGSLFWFTVRFEKADNRAS